MTRKGIRRGHTGCITCKVRRIKCDETHPYCSRCTSTGRKCDGYRPWIPRAGRSQLSTLPGAENLELRSLDFFRQVLAPRAVPLCHCFWIQTLPQWIHQEPAIRHAVVAMSSLYEQNTENSPTDQRFVVRHYNAAIAEIIKPSSRPPNLDTVVLTCILFLTIEFFSGDFKRALVHYHHCKNILSSFQAAPTLKRIFRQYEMFARFLSEFSYEQLADKMEGSPATESLGAVVDSQRGLWRLTERSLKIPFAIDNSTRTMPFNLKATLHIQSVQRGLNDELDSWARHAVQSSLYLSQPGQLGYHLKLILETRWLVCKIWTNLGSSVTEQRTHNDSTQRMSEILTRIFDIETVVPVDARDIIGLERILHLILLKSRDLDLRLAILDRFRERSYFVGGISDFQMLYSTAKRAIEDDHGIVLGSEWNMVGSNQNMSGMENMVHSGKAQFCTFWVLVCLAIGERLR